MADRRVTVEGRLIAEVGTDRFLPGGGEHCLRLFLFQGARDWTLLEVHHVTPVDEESERAGGGAEVWVSSHASLAELKAALEHDYRLDDWRDLVRTGAEQNDELRALWLPVRIDLDLSDSSVHRRDLAVHGSRRQQPGWETEALALAVARLERIGFQVLDSATEPTRIFPRGLGRAWEQSGNAIAGAVAAVKYDHRTGLVVAVDGAGEVYVRSLDTSFDPGAPRRVPPRPLTPEERLRQERLRPRRQVTGPTGLDLGQRSRRGSRS